MQGPLTLSLVPAPRMCAWRRRSSAGADPGGSCVRNAIAQPSYSARCRPYTGSAARAYSSARHSVRRLYAGRAPPPSARPRSCA